MNEDNRPRAIDTPNKRRLSLRLGVGSSLSTSDKKARTEQGQSVRSRDSVDLTDENEQPRTATSTRFTHSSYSSPTSSNDDREKAFRDRFSERQDQQPSTGLPHRRNPSYTSTWVTGESERGGLSDSSSRQHNRPSNSQNTPSASVNASRHSSPPPSFNLSSCQPLLNPPQKTQAAFVGKLYSMLEDEDIIKTGLIYWSAEGTTFTCPNPQEFSKTVLPRFFKHNNWQSFVRQLNMYSFNKVNDIYTTSVDPQAWEFRHSLFRRGEPHLLASIKRKSSRPSAQDGIQPISPTEEMVELGRPVAGWMREQNGQSQHPNVLRIASPPHGQRTIVYPYSGPNEDNRPTTIGTGGLWESRQPNSYNNVPPPIPLRMPPPLQDYQSQLQQVQSHAQSQPQSHSQSQSQSQSQSHLLSQSHSQNPRFHRDSYRPPLSAERFIPPAFSDTSHHNQQSSQNSPVDSLPNQVSVLESKLLRMAEMLNNDRIEHVRYNLDCTSYLLQMVGWASGDQPSLEMKALQDTLNRQNAEMRQKYEALMASDALSIMASGSGMSGRERAPERDRDREREREERRSRFPFDPAIPNSTRSIHATLPTPRLAPTNTSRGVTPLPSPSIREFGEGSSNSHPNSRRLSGFATTPTEELYQSSSSLSRDQQSNFKLSLPPISSSSSLSLNLTKSSNPNISYFPSSSASQIPGPVTPTVNGLTLTRSSHLNNDDILNGIKEESKLNSIISRSEYNGSDNGIGNVNGEVNRIEEIKTKSGLRDLLN